MLVCQLHVNTDKTNRTGRRLVASCSPVMRDGRRQSIAFSLLHEAVLLRLHRASTSRRDGQWLDHCVRYMRCRVGLTVSTGHNINNRSITTLIRSSMDTYT